MNKVAKSAPVWHAQVASELNKDFNEINALEMSARKRRAYLGLKFIWVKEMGRADGSIPHGQFMAWMQQRCPAIPYRTCGDYMREAKSLCDCMGWQIGDFRQFDVPPHKLIECPDAAKTKKDREAQQLLLDLVEARGKFRPVTEYKQVDDDGNPQRGNHSGKGCTKKMRLDAKFTNDQERLTALVANAPLICLWIKQNLNLNGFPRMDEVSGGGLALASIKEAFTDAHLFFSHFQKGAQP